MILVQIDVEKEGHRLSLPGAQFHRKLSQFVSDLVGLRVEQKIKFEI